MAHTALKHSRIQSKSMLFYFHCVNKGPFKITSRFPALTFICKCKCFIHHNRKCNIDCVPTYLLIPPPKIINLVIGYKS